MNGKSPYAVWLWRTLRPRQPLVRACDRFEAAVLIAMVLGVLLAFPISAAVGSEVYGEQRTVAAAQQATRHPGTAVALTDAPSQATRFDGSTAHGTALVNARWEASPGEIREGLVIADNGTVAGDHVPVWLTTEGIPMPAPMTGSDAGAVGVGVAVALWLGAATGLGLVFWIVRRALNGYREREWEREWRRVSAESNLS
jgi:hypothetical protein